MTLVARSIETPWSEGTEVCTTGNVFTPGPGTGDPTTPEVPSLDPTFIIPAAAAYKLKHEVVVTDLRDDTVLELYGFTISTDDGSVCWTLNGSGPGSLFYRFAQVEGAEPPVISIVIDGIEWQFLIEGVRRGRQIGQTDVSFTGRSLTILAGDPYSFTQNWVNEGPITAAQIVTFAQANTLLEVAWLLDDWLVPDKVWSFSGTPLAVVQRVAESVSAIVRSDRAAMRVSIVPRYDPLPNQWPLVGPDVEIHADALMTDSYERADRPDYNAVYVSGQQQGAVGRVYLAGTLADKIAPLVTDLLLTDVDAVRQRGMAILGAAGRGSRVGATLPVLVDGQAPGVLEVGQLCHIVDDGNDEWWGVVRSVSVAVNLPSVLQQVTFERHSLPVAGGTVGGTGTAVAPPFFHDTFAGTGDLSTHTPETGPAYALDNGAGSLSALVLDGAGKLTGASAGFFYLGIAAAPAAGDWYFEAKVTITADGSFGLTATDQATVGSGSAQFVEFDLYGFNAAYDVYGDDGGGYQDFPGAAAGVTLGVEHTLRLEVRSGNTVVTAKLDGSTVETVTFATPIVPSRLGIYFDDGGVDDAVLVNEIKAGAL